MQEIQLISYSSNLFSQILIIIVAFVIFIQQSYFLFQAHLKYSSSYLYRNALSFLLTFVSDLQYSCYQLDVRTISIISSQMFHVTEYSFHRSIATCLFHRILFVLLTSTYMRIKASV